MAIFSAELWFKLLVQPKCFQGRLALRNYLNTLKKINACPNPSRECPKIGWERFEGAMGRVIVGAGSSKSASLSSCEHGQIGGTERLQKKHIPSHSHTMDRLDGDDETGGRVAVQGGDRDMNLVTKGGVKTSSFGSDKPEESMPPYIVLTYCKKL